MPSCPPEAARRCATSPILLGDYKTDPEAELERPTRISLIDTETAKLRLVDLGTSYSFRSLGRGPRGEALVLGTNGTLHVIDPETGKVDMKIPVVGEWQEPLDWQQPRPTLFVRDHTAYVSEPGKRPARRRHRIGQEGQVRDPAEEHERTLRRRHRP
ncbi:hypothetical protein SCNRRL3882_0930 [Streptomyces chartreusis NRRL 3882]|uniref:PQQ enzyme repeat n=1 Tax=Streptomyces chartreusis NRRL 3882 TaxID=1079985 RepID=A0A2N9B292_STRCX|nr:hypothetical protein SCNRRL3882_0930 [Streptomyces chartreusis NRRL 3882]